MTFEELIREATRRFRDAGLEDAVTIERKVLVGVERVFFTRDLGTALRYLRVGPVVNRPRVWDFEVLGGQYRSQERGADFDGRRGGDAAHVLAVIDAWLVRLVAWADLPPPQPPRNLP